MSIASRGHQTHCFLTLAMNVLSPQSPHQLPEVQGENTGSAQGTPLWVVAHCAAQTHPVL
jgi:hypothetical protein